MTAKQPTKYRCNKCGETFYGLLHPIKYGREVTPCCESIQYTEL